MTSLLNSTQGREPPILREGVFPEGSEGKTLGISASEIKSIKPKFFVGGSSGNSPSRWPSNHRSREDNKNLTRISSIESHIQPPILSMSAGGHPGFNLSGNPGDPLLSTAKFTSGKNIVRCLSSQLEYKNAGPSLEEMLQPKNKVKDSLIFPAFMSKKNLFRPKRTITHKKNGSSQLVSPVKFKHKVFKQESIWDKVEKYEKTGTLKQESTRAGLESKNRVSSHNLNNYSSAFSSLGFLVKTGSNPNAGIGLANCLGKNSPTKDRSPMNAILNPSKASPRDKLCEEFLESGVSQNYLMRSSLNSDDRTSRQGKSQRSHRSHKNSDDLSNFSLLPHQICIDGNSAGSGGSGNASGQLPLKNSSSFYIASNVSQKDGRICKGQKTPQNTVFPSAQFDAQPFADTTPHCRKPPMPSNGLNQFDCLPRQLSRKGSEFGIHKNPFSGIPEENNPKITHEERLLLGLSGEPSNNNSQKNPQVMTSGKAQIINNRYHLGGFDKHTFGNFDHNDASQKEKNLILDTHSDINCCLCYPTTKEVKKESHLTLHQRKSSQFSSGLLSRQDFERENMNEDLDQSRIYEPRTIPLKVFKQTDMFPFQPQPKALNFDTFGALEKCSQVLPSRESSVNSEKQSSLKHISVSQILDSSQGEQEFQNLNINFDNMKKLSKMLETPQSQSSQKSSKSSKSLKVSSEELPDQNQYGYLPGQKKKTKLSYFKRKMTIDKIIQSVEQD